MSLAPAGELLPPSPEASTERAWKLPWLTPGLCRALLVALILFGAISHILYLHSESALELSPDEAQYWVWSQQLDWSYYSKGPMVALIIRASTEIFGDTMMAVRYPAILIGVLMTLMTYWLTRKLFGSDKLALGAVALTHFVPMYIAGSLIMTIDPPYVLFWSAATCLFFKAVLDEAKWAWIGVGAMVGLSFLAKYFAPVLYVGLLIGLALDRRYRHHLRSPWIYAGAAVMALFTLPVVYWNQQHGWVTAHHVSSDVSNGFNPMQPFSFLGGQLALVGPFLCVILVAAVAHAFRAPAENEGAARARLLVYPGLVVLLIVGFSSFTTNAQLNWTAPAWFGLLICGAWFLSTRMVTAAGWKKWRGFVWGTVVFGLVIMPVAHHVRDLWPAFEWFERDVLGKQVRIRGEKAEEEWSTMTAEQKKNVWSVRKFDPTARLLGWRDLAEDLENRRLASVGPDAFYMFDDYSEASELAFYGKDHPKTYIMGQYITELAHRGRSSQWDVWPDRSLERGKTQLIGRNAIYIGYPWPDLNLAFDRVETLGLHEIFVPSHGKVYHIGGYRVTACYGFKGFVRPADGKSVY